MIAQLKGILDYCTDDCAVIDVGGVGYLVHCARTTIARLPQPGEAVRLHIETQVREESITLFGFLALHEQEWFRILNGVQGVGAKLALAILGTLGVDGIADAIALQDKTAVARTNGVGPKLAARIVNELKDKGPPLALRTGNAPSGQPADTSGTSGAAGATGAGQTQPAIFQDALSALINLGYKEADAHRALATARRMLAAHEGEGAAVDEVTLDELIRIGLRELST